MAVKQGSHAQFGIVAQDGSEKVCVGKVWDVVGYG